MNVYVGPIVVAVRLHARAGGIDVLRGMRRLGSIQESDQSDRPHDLLKQSLAFVTACKAIEFGVDRKAIPLGPRRGVCA